NGRAARSAPGEPKRLRVSAAWRRISALGPPRRASTSAGTAASPNSATATVREQGGNVMTGVGKTFTSRNTAIATVAANGTIHGVAKGQTVIVANVTGN